MQRLGYKNIHICTHTISIVCDVHTATSIYTYICTIIHTESHKCPRTHIAAATHADVYASACVLLLTMTGPLLPLNRSQWCNQHTYHRSHQCQPIGLQIHTRTHIQHRAQCNWATNSHSCAHLYTQPRAQMHNHSHMYIHVVAIN